MDDLYKKKRENQQLDSLRIVKHTIILTLVWVVVAFLIYTLKNLI